MEAVGNIDEFMKYKLALSLENASLNQSSAGESMGGGIGAGLGLGMGFMMPQMLQQSITSSNSNPETNENKVVEKLKDLKQLLDMGIINNKEYDEKRSKLIEKL